MKYRPEIDGLRSLAIIPVVLFHAGFEIFSGGFVGVDVFFVISGYLIASIILSEIQANTFSYISFYERRIRRILPALLVVILSSLAISLVISLPEQVIQTAEASVFAIFGVSNIYFWSQSGYFAPNSDYTMLLHTWSLGVEEQFYIFLAPLILLVYRFQWKLALVVGLSLPLLFMAGFWLSLNKPSVAFYLLPARAWELGLGVALAVGLFPPAKRKKIAATIASVGFVLVVASAFQIDKTMIFPGWVALLPCLGAAAMIHSASSENSVGRFLALPPLRFIGLLSYSLYLWHWPVFVALRMYTAEPHLSSTSAMVGILVSLALSIATWKFVETPFRSQRTMSFKRVLAGAGAVGSLCVALATVAILSAGFPDRLNERSKKLFSATKDTNPLGDRCPRMHAIDDPACRFGDPNAEIDFILVGDSHAGAIRPAIEVWAKAAGRAGTIIWRGGCPTLLGAKVVPDSDANECTAHKQALLDVVEGYDGIKTVFIAGRWETAYSGIAPEIGGSYRTYLIDDQNQERTDEATKRVFENAISRAARRFEALGAKVIMIGSVPEIGFDVPRVLALASHNQDKGGTYLIDRPSDRSVALDETFARIAAASPNRAYISIWETFCTPHLSDVSTIGTDLKL